MKIIVINGPNLNMLGIREKEIYGTQTYDDLLAYINEYCSRNGIETEFYQSNHEGDLIDRIQACYKKFDGIVINPGGYTMTSAALADTVFAIGIPTVEVHISDMDSREKFRKRSYIGQACIKTISGHGFRGYIEAIEEIRAYLTAGRKENAPE